MRLISQAEAQLNDINFLKSRDAVIIAQSEIIKEFVEKAQAVIDRWNSRDWKDGTHTRDYIFALRDVVMKVKEIK